jgi:hypothetical protein
MAGCNWNANDWLGSRIRGGAVHQWGHFRVTDPGPVLDFSLRRDEGLDLILATRIAPDAKSTTPEHPSSTVRIVSTSKISAA